MTRLSGLLLGACVLLGAMSVAEAQEKSGATMGPPKVLVIDREFVKPGKAGTLHQKTESLFVNAFTAAKWPTHYFAMDSMSGPSRSLFFIGYDSFAAWEKDNLAVAKNATLSAALDRALAADGELLTLSEAGAYTYREDLSLRANVNVATMRYFDISLFKIRQGHQKEWEELAKMYIDGYTKAVPDGRWATFESMYGMQNGGVFIVITPMKSLAEVDQGMSDGKKFAAAMGDDGMKKISELSAACIESVQDNLFAFSPKMSYVSEDWVKADPTFWKVKASAPAKAPEAKPAQ